MIVLRRLRPYLLATATTLVSEAESLTLQVQTFSRYAKSLCRRRRLAIASAECGLDHFALDACERRQQFRLKRDRQFVAVRSIIGENDPGTTDVAVDIIGFDLCVWFRERDDAANLVVQLPDGAGQRYRINRSIVSSATVSRPLPIRRQHRRRID